MLPFFLTSFWSYLLVSRFPTSSFSSVNSSCCRLCFTFSVLSSFWSWLSKHADSKYVSLELSLDLDTPRSRHSTRATAVNASEPIKPLYMVVNSRSDCDNNGVQRCRSLYSGHTHSFYSLMFATKVKRHSLVCHCGRVGQIHIISRSSAKTATSIEKMVSQIFKTIVSK